MQAIDMELKLKGKEVEIELINSSAIDANLCEVDRMVMNIYSGIGLVSSGDKPLLEPMLPGYFNS